MASIGSEVNDDFPVVCETCLGENPYVRMTKQPYGKECKVCGRPFTVFKWCPGKRMRMKRTEICNTCCKLKNMCSTCALDLDLKVPIRVRDLALGLKDPIAKQDRNREFYVQNAERDMAANGGKTNLGVYGKLGAPGREVLKKLADSAPYKRKLEGYEDSDEIARRDEMFQTNPMEASKTTRTIFVTGIGKDTTESDIREYFFVWGDISAIQLVAEKKSAFITYEDRKAALNALMSCRSGFTLKGTLCKAFFAKPKRKAPESASTPPSTSGIVDAQK